MIDPVDDERATILGPCWSWVPPTRLCSWRVCAVLRIDGDESSDTIVDEIEIDGPISDILSRLDDKLRSHNQRSNRPGEQRPRAPDRTLPYRSPPTAGAQRDHASYLRVHERSRSRELVQRQDRNAEPGLSIRNRYNGELWAACRDRLEDSKLGRGDKDSGICPEVRRRDTDRRRLLQEAGHPPIQFTIEPTHLLATVWAVPQQVGDRNERARPDFLNNKDGGGKTSLVLSSGLDARAKPVCDRVSAFVTSTRKQT